MSGASGSGKPNMDEIMKKWESLKCEWYNNKPMANLILLWNKIKADWERITPKLCANESFQNRLNLERSCGDYSTSFDKVVQQVIVEQSQLRDEFDKLKIDLLGLSGLLPDCPIVISDSDDDEIFREIEEYCDDDDDDDDDDDYDDEGDDDNGGDC
ncbi:PREDICTED: mitochondrial distribution and morphology protein 12-like [Nicotiana attenuata]|uniref:mitochondrial distribution and morphology protein 12-like n=1 Tax=Nicotiana attenuata TaxID=49451 RepID=UPI00090521C4|nr:PREDICTED: mitochondrial distribution and morphology protein 12-like [Nicotiana attenuata]